jgi:hypothetical protein
MCTHKYLETTYYTQLCSLCGIEKNSGIKSQTGYTINQPLWFGYSRTNRFRKILNLLFKPELYGSISGKIILEMQKKEFQNIRELLVFLKKIKSKKKNYNSMHYYAKMFVPRFKQLRAPSIRIQESILSDFSLVENLHKEMFSTKRFFSYRWLLRKLLVKYKLFKFMPLVKKVQNKHSNKRYLAMYNTLMNVGKRSVTQDTPPKTGKLPEQPPVRGSGFVCLSSSCSEQRHEALALLRGAFFECHRKVDSVLGN